jgi:hypothetical protein
MKVTCEYAGAAYIVQIILRQHWLLHGCLTVLIPTEFTIGNRISIVQRESLFSSPLQEKNRTLDVTFFIIYTQIEK